MRAPATPIPNYMLLDAARMQGELHKARELNPDHTCLYEGDSEKFLSAIAPGLFSFDPGTEFGAWVIAEAKGKSWGVFMRSEADPVKIYKHLRKFLIVENEEGKEMYFRYYDPRVLRAFLPTCGNEQLTEFFGPIQAFVAEDKDALMVEYKREQMELMMGASDVAMDAYFAGGEVKRTPMQAQPIQGPSGADLQGNIPQAAKRWDFGY